MKRFALPSSLLVILAALFLLGLNITFFNFIFAGLKDSSEPVFLGFLIPSIYFFLLCALLFLFNFKYILKPVLILLIIIASLSSYFMSKFGVILDSDMLANALATDSKEAFSYLNLGFFTWLFLLVILPCFIVFKLKIKRGKTLFKAIIASFGGFLFCLGLAGLLFVLGSQSLVPFFRSHNMAKRLHVPFYPIFGAYRLAQARLEPFETYSPIASDASLANSEPKLLIFVLGETARAQNYSALGYSINETNAFTAPFVNAKKAAFASMSSCGTATMISVPCMFSPLGRKDFDLRANPANALDVLNSLGVDISWFDNNTGGCKEVCERIKTTNLSSDYDEDLLALVEKKILEFQNKNMAIFVHLQGSHGPTYYERYPKDFARFAPTCDTSELAKCDLKSIANTYDNTLLYTDFILSKLISLIEPLGQSAALMYASDHGESLGENGMYLHGLPYSIAPDTQKQVPFFVYNENLVQSMKKTPLSHDFIFHTLLGYFGVESKIYKAKLDIFAK